MLVMTHDTAGSTGVDYELIRDKIFRISPRFMSSMERREAGPNAGSDRLHIYWGAKESLFKKHGTGSLTFSEDLYVEPFRNCEEGETRGIIRVGGEHTVNKIAYKKYGTHMLVYIIND